MEPGMKAEGVLATWGLLKVAAGYILLPSGQEQRDTKVQNTVIALQK